MTDIIFFSLALIVGLLAFFLFKKRVLPALISVIVVAPLLYYLLGTCRFSESKGKCRTSGGVSDGGILFSVLGFQNPKF